MSLIPLTNRILLKREKLKSTLIIPEDAVKRNARCRGVCVAVGPDAREGIEVEKTYVWGAHAGAWIDEEGRQSAEGEFYITNDDDLLCEVT